LEPSSFFQVKSRLLKDSKQRLDTYIQLSITYVKMQLYSVKMLQFSPVFGQFFETTP